MSDTCGATCDLDAETLVCDLDAGHDGPVHSDDGHAWGDTALPNPAHREPVRRKPRQRRTT